MDTRLSLLLKSFPESKLLASSEEDWSCVFFDSSAGPEYSLSVNRYQACYIKEKVEEYFNLSMVLHHDGAPVAIWPLGLKKEQGKYVLISNATDVMAPIFKLGLSEKIGKTTLKRCLEFLKEVCKAFNIESWVSEHRVGMGGCGQWFSTVMPEASKTFFVSELYVDLTLSFETIWKSIRKSYRPLITRAEKLWKVEVHERCSREVFDEFRRLHYSAAGKETRSLETWNLQFESILQGESFLVVLRDDLGSMVGGGYFELSSSVGMYSVGAYNRDLFDLPLGHLVQVSAIRHMQELGLKKYFIGVRHYPPDFYPPTEKELNISVFKEGFATNVYPKIQILCETG